MCTRRWRRKRVPAGKGSESWKRNTGETLVGVRRVLEGWKRGRNVFAKVDAASNNSQNPLPFSLLSFPPSALSCSISRCVLHAFLFISTFPHPFQNTSTTDYTSIPTLLSFFSLVTIHHVFSFPMSFLHNIQCFGVVIMITGEWQRDVVRLLYPQPLIYTFSKFCWLKHCGSVVRWSTDMGCRI